MKKSILSNNEINNAIKEIVNQIDISGFTPEIIISINRGGCIPGVYLSHYFKKPHNIIDIKSLKANSLKDFSLLTNTLKKNKSVLVIDDINDSGKTFDIVKKIFSSSNNEIRFAALINNVSSKTKIDFHGQLIDKRDNPVWYVFPWENW
ncbi:MAG: phosphoribosyltransferase [Candidatus Marisimplicoccus sp.]|tara:strand:- start:341 stop:787 length:447 start_codon:yes stop_codon:yes gene_type:complete